MSKCELCIVREMSSLKTLTKDEITTLASCRTSQTIKKGEILFDEGDAVNGIYCIKDGICKMTKLSSNGKDQIVKLVKRGEILGQRSLISEEPANLSAVALEDMNVCFIPKNEVMTFINSNPQFAVSLMKTISHDLKEADDQMVSLAQKSVKERLADTLLHLEASFDVDNENCINVHLTREELAGMIGTATESCIRLLSEFKKDGLIELNGKKIEIKDKNKLKRIAN